MSMKIEEIFALEKTYFIRYDRPKKKLILLIYGCDACAQNVSAGFALRTYLDLTSLRFL